MQYTTLPPHPALAPYIDAYWSVKGAGQDTATNRILPDGCVDIIFNLGEDDPVMKSGKAYLVGTMTRSFDSVVVPGTHLMGIRFKPGAFSAFYSFFSLHAITDNTIECEKGLAPEMELLKEPLEGLNRFFLERFSRPRHTLFPILEDIHRHHGQVRVEELTRRHFITARQLERNFSYYIGVSPKEFINQERFRHALHAIRQRDVIGREETNIQRDVVQQQQNIFLRQKGKDLSDIALACGYYDQAHLSNEIKKYTGTAPSQL